VNTKNPLLLAAIGFVLVGFAFFHFALQPKQKQASALNSKISDAKGDLDAARALLASNTAARQTYKDSYAKVVRLGKAVPGDDDVRSLVVQLNTAARRTHVDFSSIEVGSSTTSASAPALAPGAAPVQLPPGATIGPAGFPVMPFSFSFRGGFFRLAKFFQRLDSFVKANNDKIDVSGRLLTVDGIKLEPDTTGFPNIKATVQATSYLVSPLEGATGGATPSGPAGTTPEAGTPADGGRSLPTTTATSTGAIR
jgi:hypothetical protein